jgi:3-phosphoshikimate 1-carboxyvinyltransferase
MESIKLKKLEQVSGSVILPGSKSIANRVQLIAALSQGSTVLKNLPANDDVSRMFDALKQLGVEIEGDLKGKAIKIEGCAGPLPSGDFKLFLENAGTAYRPLTAALCLGQGTYTLDCVARMKERPIKDLTEALKLLGARIEHLEQPDCPPLKIHADGGLNGGVTSVKGNVSSQYLTSLLMVAPYFKDDTEIKIDGELTSKPYIDMTIKLMKQFGVEVENDNYSSFSVKGAQIYKSPGELFVEPDASSASYFLAAAAIEGEIFVPGITQNSIQGEAGFVSVLQQMGADVRWINGGVYVKSAPLQSINIDMNTMTDTGMTLAVLSLFAKGQSTIRNIANWQVKESPRITAVATELRKLGAEVEEGADFIRITPPESIKPATISTYHDHRMAMAFAIASMGSDSIIIEDPACTSKTFPDFFQCWGNMG